MQQRHRDVFDQDSVETQRAGEGGDHHGQDAAQQCHRRSPEQCRHVEEVSVSAGEKT